MTANNTGCPKKKFPSSVKLTKEGTFFLGHPVPCLHKHLRNKQFLVCSILEIYVAKYIYSTKWKDPYGGLLLAPADGFTFGPVNFLIKNIKQKQRIQYICDESP